MASAIRDFLTGANNESLSIGRVLGTLLFVNLLLALPIVIVAALFLQHVGIDEWVKLLNALSIYVPATILSVGGLIAGTAFTEPKAETVPSSTTTVVASETKVG